MGCLGAAKIAPGALIRPARVLPGVEVRAVAARDRRSGRGVRRQEPSPGGVRVLRRAPRRRGHRAPSTTLSPTGSMPSGPCAPSLPASTCCARSLLPPTHPKPSGWRAAAAASGLVVMEAFHWRYHPLARSAWSRSSKVASSGYSERVEAAFCFPLPFRHDIRWQLSLAGGAMMDAGCYAVHMVRTMAGAEPAVTTATARLRSPGVDRYMRAEMEFPDGSTGRVTASMWSSSVLTAFGRRDRRPKDDAGVQPIGAAHVSPPLGRSSPRTHPWRSHLRLPARDVRGGRPAPARRPSRRQRRASPTCESSTPSTGPPVSNPGRGPPTDPPGRARTSAPPAAGSRRVTALNGRWQAKEGSSGGYCRRPAKPPRAVAQGGGGCGSSV